MKMPPANCVSPPPISPSLLPTSVAPRPADIAPPVCSSKSGSLVSVIIPCYNQAQFLPEAIESVLAQTYAPVELIVVDDGSPDDTAEVVRRYSGVHYIRQSNRGVAAARNTGLAASRGEYIIFLDADDRLTRDAIEAHLRCFAEHWEAAFVVGDIDHISVGGCYAGSPRWPHLREGQYEELLRVNHLANTVGVMFRRQTLETVGDFNEEVAPAADYELLLRAARHFPSAHHGSVVAQYRRHNNSMSRDGVLMLRTMRRVMRLHRESATGAARLQSAWKEGDVYWRALYSRVATWELCRHLAALRFCKAARTAAVLGWNLLVLLVRAPRKMLGFAGAGVRKIGSHAVKAHSGTGRRRLFGEA